MEEEEMQVKERAADIEGEKRQERAQTLHVQ